MKKFNYSLPTSSTFCASFDYGFVWAKDADEAREKAIHELNYNVEKVNSVLAHTLGFSIEICTDELTIEETKENIVDLVIDQIKNDAACRDFTAIEELLEKLLENNCFELLKGYLPEGL